MKLSHLASSLLSSCALVALAAFAPTACSETIIQAAPADGGGADGGTSDGGAACTPAAVTSCSCPAGKTGTSTCDDTGAPGVCQCGLTSLTDHTVISRSGRSAIEVETDLAMAADGTMASVWISLGGSGASDIGYVFSRDGGATWTAPALTGDDAGRESSDPVIAVDAQGNFYVTWIAFRRSGAAQPSDFVLYVAKAAAGQSKFGTPVAVDTFSTGDKPWITVTAAGTVLATYMADVGGVSTLYAQRSTDGGGTWTRSTIFTSTGGEANFVVPCAPKTGSRVWATHLSVEGSGLLQRLHWSDDDGASWPAANTKTYGVNSSIVPATCVAKGSDVWIAYGQWTSQPTAQEDPVDEYHVMHTSNGTTLDDVVASDTATKKQNLGSLAIDDATGEMSLTYYAGDADGATGNVRSVRSTNGGKAWSKSTVVSAPLNFTSDRASQKWLGDYMGSVLRGGSLFLTYGENADSFTHVAFSKTP
jgi:hypothetical protein